jgi:hypothetical protein
LGRQKRIVTVDDAKTHEEAFVRAFIVPRKRARYVELLRKRRSRVTRELPHFRDLDPRFAEQVAPPLQSADRIESLLRQRHAPAICHVISQDQGIDGECLALGEALEIVVGNGLGTILSCVPGHLAYYEGETA